MNKGFPEPRFVDPMVEAPSWHYEDVPVVDGVATLPDGTTVRSTAQVLRVAVALVLPPIPEEPDSLDAAWADAEAALPGGWVLDRLWDRLWDRESKAQWTARAVGGGSYTAFIESEPCTTPAAALRALAERLRERTG
jgi:hypothetical protein